ncbi:uncharacterized protein LOC126901442 [Daktulosphaira vitifoliae]|uniref:uncharacterized protein LOC126901442 n=1 Tax=Daktulosphaira vitifoliae TaxID=58002 RepID=UPI0021AA1C61|nr:uncharacterized protein LOC126901442 [Daktulosphaira vitifoliae]
MRKIVFSCLLLIAAHAAYAHPAADEGAAPVIDENAGLEKIYKVMQECSEKNVATCLKMRALQYVDHALRRSDDIDVFEGISLVKTGPVESSRGLNGRSLSESELDDNAAKDGDDKDAAVENLLLDRIARFFESHTLQLKVPESSISGMRRSLEEARGKKKKQQKMLMPLLMMLKMKAIALIPLAIGALALLAFKALVVGKIALVLAVIIGIQKLLANKHTPSVEVHPHYTEEHGHHYKRSLDAQNMAYRGQH